jgi:hypothetical protein
MVTLKHNGIPKGPGYVAISFWPSEEEIKESACEDGYLGAFTEFYSSLDELLAELRNRDIPSYLINYIGVWEGKRVHAAFPPEVAEFLIDITTGVSALVLVLKLWVSLKNGRKIKVKTNYVEVEATQLTEKQFLKLFRAIKDYGDKEEKALGAEKFESYRKIRISLTDELTAKLASEGFMLTDCRKPESERQRLGEKRGLRLLARERSKWSKRRARRRKLTGT